MRLRRGDIVLIPVPFTDLSSRKILNRDPPAFPSVTTGAAPSTCTPRGTRSAPTSPRLALHLERRRRPCGTRRSTSPCGTTPTRGCSTWRVAIAFLPSLSIGVPTLESPRATGTDDARAVAPNVAPAHGRDGQNVTVRDRFDARGNATDTKRKPKKCRVSCVFPAKREIPSTGIEPVTFSSGG